MKTKEEILETHFGSDYYSLKERDDLQYILRAMDEYADQFKHLHKPAIMQDEESEKAKQKQLLIDMMKEDEKNGMYDVIAVAMNKPSRDQYRKCLCGCD